MIGLLLAAAVVASASEPVDVVVAGLDRQFEGAIGPISFEEGGVSAVLALSDVGATLHSHRLELSRTDAGCCAARVELDVSGEAQARLSVVDTPLALDDQVVAPRQRLIVEGRVAVAVDEGGAVTFTLLEGPPVVAARVESGLADGLGLACVLTVGSGPCAALLERFGRIEVPAPTRGAQLRLPPGALDPATVERLRVLAGR